MTCPKCESNQLQRVGQNLWCPYCGFFPLPFGQEEKEVSDIPSAIFATPKNKYLGAHALVAAFWLSYFTLHWLLILEVVERTATRAGTALFFFVFAVLLTLLIDARDDPEVEK